MAYQSPSDAKLFRWHDAALLQFASALREFPDALVPFYPGWTLRHLAAHVIHVHRMACASLRQGGRQRPAFEPVDATTETEAMLSELDGIAVRLASEADTCTHHAVWTPSAHTDPHFWRRRMLSESALHLWDAERARERSWTPGTELSLELIDEFVHTRFLGSVNAAKGKGSLRLLGDDVEWALPHDDESDACVAAAAADLWLWLNRRFSGDGNITHQGNSAAIASFEAMLDALRRPDT